MAQPLLNACNLTKRFNKGTTLEIFTDLNFTLNEGETVAIVGSSGTGKTTLLNILGTLEKPCSGTLYLRGENIFDLKGTKLAAFRNRTIGFVFQFHHLLPEFSALENIIIPGMIAGIAKDELTDDAMQLLTKVGLNNRSSHKVGELSGGEQQRVSLARALIMKPSILLADEPTGNLDPKTGEKVFQLIVEMNEAYSLSTVMVTHNMTLAKTLGSCLTLDKGKLHKTF
nr:ABC transporter ATP-binding protein [Desulfobulbaceae bacterium]